MRDGFLSRVIAWRVRSHALAARAQSFADWGLILFPSFAPCVRFRPRFTLSHRLRRWLRPPSLAPPLPTQERLVLRYRFAPLRSLPSTSHAMERRASRALLSACDRTRQVTSYSPPSRPKTFYSPFKRYALASAFIHISLCPSHGLLMWALDGKASSKVGLCVFFAFYASTSPSGHGCDLSIKWYSISPHATHYLDTDLKSQTKPLLMKRKITFAEFPSTAIEGEQKQKPNNCL